MQSVSKEENCSFFSQLVVKMFYKTTCYYSREEVIAYYSQLTEEAARREQKALWRVRRGRLDLARSDFLLQQERQWAADMEKAKNDPVRKFTLINSHLVLLIYDIITYCIKEKEKKIGPISL